MPNGMRRIVMVLICESGNLLVIKDEASEQGIASTVRHEKVLPALSRLFFCPK